MKTLDYSSECIDVVHCPRAAAKSPVTKVALAEDLQSGLEASQFTLTGVPAAGP
jgi:hypothetical protein